MTDSPRANINSKSISERSSARSSEGGSAHETIVSRLTTIVSVFALTGVATLGSGCGFLSTENAVKITGHMSDAAGLTDAQKAELTKITALASERLTDRTSNGDSSNDDDATEIAGRVSLPKSELAGSAAEPQLAVERESASATGHARTGEWIDRIAHLVAIFSGERESSRAAGGESDRAEN